MEMILAIDPGREKTGWAILKITGEIVSHGIIPSEDLLLRVNSLLAELGQMTIVMGNGTSSRDKLNYLRDNLKELDFQLVNEYATTEEGRKLYFQMNPPKGWRKLIPQGMLVPRTPIDDYAAMVIGRRYLEEKNK